MHIRDASGALVLPGDPRVVEVLGRAGELGLPVVIHTADPVAFFDPLDERNERLDELAEVPQWWFGDPSRYPSFETLMASLDALLGGVPGTTVIGAHVGCHAEDLGVVSAMLDRHPNFHVDLGAGSPRSGGSHGPSPASSRHIPTGCSSAPMPSRWTPRRCGRHTGSWRPTTSTSPTPLGPTSHRRDGGPSAARPCRPPTSRRSTAAMRCVSACSRGQRTQAGR